MTNISQTHLDTPEHKQKEAIIAQFLSVVDTARLYSADKTPEDIDLLVTQTTAFLSTECDLSDFEKYFFAIAEIFGDQELDIALKVRIHESLDYCRDYYGPLDDRRGYYGPPDKWITILFSF